MNGQAPPPSAPGGGPFFWGVATSGYQHEGGYNEPGGPENNWVAWERSHRVQRSGKAVDFWNRYEEDFARARQIGLNAFRLSVEWSRVQPGPASAGRNPAPPFSETALAHYARMLASARRHGLEPLVTLFHFTHPAWLGTDPWLDAAMPERFAAYAGQVVRALNGALASDGVDPVRWFITVNEPNMLVVNTYSAHSFPGRGRRNTRSAARAYENLMLAHVLAWRELHRTFAANPAWGRPRAAFNNYASDVYWNDKFLVDMVCAPSLGVPRSEIIPWLHGRYQAFNRAFEAAMLPVERSVPFWFGMFVKWLLHWVGQWRVTEKAFARLIGTLYEDPGQRPLDFIALDYYDPFIGHAFRLPRFDEMRRPGEPLRGWLIQSMTSKWWDWRVLPQGLHFFVDLYHRDFTGMEIVIAENGMAQRRAHAAEPHWRRDAMHRGEFLRQHLEVVAALRARGVPMRGYFHWSLTDNYEWGSYTPRFGLQHVAFQSRDLAREPLDAGGDDAAGAYARLIREIGSRTDDREPAAPHAGPAG